MFQTTPSQQNVFSTYPSGFRGGSNRPFRFPGDLSRHDVEGVTFDERVDLSESEKKSQRFNIIAELAKYSNKRNLIDKASNDPYIKYQNDANPSMEVIMYPSGQLVPGSTTLGPKLENFLVNNRQFSASNPLNGNKYQQYADQDSYNSYVLTRKQPEELAPTESALEVNKEDFVPSDDEGFLPKLWRSAKDDFKLVGNVLKFALSRWNMIIANRNSCKI